MQIKSNPCLIRVEDAAKLIGMHPQTLRLCLQQGYFSNIGEAIKTDCENECYSYNISKFQLFEYLGLDVNVSVEDAIDMISKGSPPYRNQLPKAMIDAWNEMCKEKDTTAIQSK